MNNCTECGGYIPFGKSCPCKADRGRKGHDITGKSPDQECSFVYGQMRCPLAPSVQVEGRWLCRSHHRSVKEGDIQVSVDFLKRAISDPKQAMMETYEQPWQEVLHKQILMGDKRPKLNIPKVEGFGSTADIKIPQFLQDKLKSQQNICQKQTETGEIDELLGW